MDGLAARNPCINQNNGAGAGSRLDYAHHFLISPRCLNFLFCFFVEKKVRAFIFTWCVVYTIWSRNTHKDCTQKKLMKERERKKKSSGDISSPLCDGITGNGMAPWETAAENKEGKRIPRYNDEGGKDTRRDRCGHS